MYRVSTGPTPPATTLDPSLSPGGVLPERTASPGGRGDSTFQPSDYFNFGLAQDRGLSRDALVGRPQDSLGLAGRLVAGDAPEPVIPDPLVSGLGTSSRTGPVALTPVRGRQSR